MAIYRHSYVFRLAVTPVLYAWTGFGDLETPADSIDASGATWLGAAHILDIPSLRTLLNGAADRIDILVSGTSAETLRLAQEDRADVKDASVMIGRVSFDADWQLDGGIAWFWRGTADVMTIAGRDTDQGRERTISLSVRTGDTRRSDPLPAFFTYADQQRRSADDEIFDHVAQITIGVTRRFGASA